MLLLDTTGSMKYGTSKDDNTPRHETIREAMGIIVATLEKEDDQADNSSESEGGGLRTITFAGNKAKAQVSQSDDNAIAVTGTCKGSEKVPYELELKVPQAQETLESDGWSGTCSCEQSSKKANICSHQVAILMELDDQQRLAKGITTTSDKGLKKKVSIEKTMTASQKKKYNLTKEEMSSKSVSELQGMLRFNAMKVTGKKVELIERVAEAMTLGICSRCPQCSGGRPRFENGYWVCPGYMDDDEFQECSFVEREIAREDWKEEQ